MGSGLDDWIYWHLIHSTRDYRQYSAIDFLHTLRFTVPQALGFSVFTSRILATDLYQSVPSNHTWSLLVTAYFPSWYYSSAANSGNSAQFNSKLISLQAGVSKLHTSLSSTLPLCSYYSVPSSVSFLLPFGTDHTKNIACVFDEVCLPRRCLAIDVLLFFAFASAVMCLTSRCLATSILLLSGARSNTEAFQKPLLHNKLFKLFLGHNVHLQIYWTFFCWTYRYETLTPPPTFRNSLKTRELHTNQFSLVQIQPKYSAIH
jgi:hypothetical protein